MERILVDFILAICFFVIVTFLYFVGKFSKNLFKTWDIESKRFMCGVCIFSLCGLGFLSSCFEKYENIFGIIALLVVIFLILLATNIHATKK